ncbi:MAG TPA: hypothetical protein VFE32_17305 [Puia sp.]|jgi:hypothetical protein|nr:hypothetical protein [Puia sp.]
MKKKEQPPKTKMGQLMMFIDQMDLFLHPRIMDALKKAVWEARTEMAQEALDQKISRELQELEPFLKRYRDSIQIYSSGSAPARLLWHMRPLLQKIIELYGNQDTCKK